MDLSDRGASPTFCRVCRSNPIAGATLDAAWAKCRRAWPLDFGPSTSKSEATEQARTFPGDLAQTRPALPRLDLFGCRPIRSGGELPPCPTVVVNMRRASNADGLSFRVTERTGKRGRSVGQR